MLCLRLTLFFALFCIIIGQPVNKEENERIPEHLRVKRDFPAFPLHDPGVAADEAKSGGGRFGRIRRRHKKRSGKKGAFKH